MEYQNDHTEEQRNEDQYFEEDIHNFDEVHIAHRAPKIKEAILKNDRKMRAMEKGLSRQKEPSDRRGKMAKKSEGRRAFILGTEEEEIHDDEVIKNSIIQRVPMQRIRRKLGHRTRAEEPNLDCEYYLQFCIDPIKVD